MQELGSTHHLALGSSMGGNAALYFAARCGMDKAIAFSPTFPVQALCGPIAQAAAWLDFRLLIRSPRNYLTHAGLVSVNRLFYRRLAKSIGEENIDSMYDAYLRDGPLPDANAYYGKNASYDRMNANLLAGSRSVKLFPLPTSSHNTGGYLERDGRLFSTISGHINHMLSIK